MKPEDIRATILKILPEDLYGSLWMDKRKQLESLCLSIAQDSRNEALEEAADLAYKATHVCAGVDQMRVAEGISRQIRSLKKEGGK